MREVVSAIDRRPVYPLSQQTASQENTISTILITSDAMQSHVVRLKSFNP